MFHACQLLKFETILLLDSMYQGSLWDPRVLMHMGAVDGPDSSHFGAIFCLSSRKYYYYYLRESRYIGPYDSHGPSNNRGPPHGPNNVKRAIESRAHHRDPTGYRLGAPSGADATGCNSRNFCVPAPSVSRAFPRQAGPSRAEPSTGGRKASRSARRTRRMRFLTCREVKQRSTRPRPRSIFRTARLMQVGRQWSMRSSYGK